MCVAADWRRLHWWVVLQWVVGVALSGPCSQRCDCVPKLPIVNCSSRQLASVPDGLPDDTQTLNLSGNQLRTLTRRRFTGLTLLRELDLSENMLTAIEAEAFAGLQNLLTLRLARNRLKIIPVGAFSGLPNVQVLDISENEILVFLDDMFREMPSLQKLEASENDLVFISNRAFGGLANLQELNLDRCNLTTVPVEALSPLTGLLQLRLCRLGITSLPNHSFRTLIRLRELHVSHCPWLDSLAANSLIGLNLSSLTLSHCNLSAVPYSPLHHLVYLRYLDLSYNPISIILPNLLGDLLRLQELHLVGAGLLRIEPGAFRNLAGFRLLNVSGNRLATLESSAFHSVGTLEVLRLDGNPLACDCRLLWVMRRRSRISFGRSPTCGSPVQVQGRTLHDFSEAELPRLFTCRQARVLTRKPQDVRTDEGHTVLFFCAADGDPAPAITWVNPKRSVLTGSGRVRVLPNGTLEVRYAQVQDSGYYLCVASNAAGNDSVSVSLRVRGFPASTRNRSGPFFLEGWSFTSGQVPVNGSQPFPFDVKTLVIAVTMGFLSFLSSVAVCFVFMFFWSQSKGQIKHTATIDFVPRSSASANRTGRSSVETGRFTMKLI
ncbi:leucine-rich repeat and immunoglobulin-like domain-containing nogo receptor-interacting protein 4a [Pimephales promelas]|uniref:leucine-rich repeat and immunoglobulin-like domain-containing nogo receptor-interacting protein 4a n=1 Tax=Pimephales promelas TaxID=90988 RepID=UPI001955618C|nr:leucine-rich repeat and immunoglobulin-like domain-containing nogo receptor-interacting protein 4a [Pimephales promelas]KAG1929001.1 leucine-rich repeat and immunoglobulin-like domain-containing nogo receptor-interacting protein [Pimephales promelas]